MDEVASISDISQWQSIVTLVVFVLSNLVVLLPFHIPIFIYRPFAYKFLDGLAAFRFIPPRQRASPEADDRKLFMRLRFPVNLTTGPLIGVLFLLSINVIGRTEVHDGTIGANNISPIDIIAFALTIGYIGSSIDCAGFIRFLTIKVLRRYGGAGHRLFISVYMVFFLIGCFLGNDIVIQMGMLFLIYLNQAISNLQHPRAWIHTQFALANIASTILVSSSTTNVVLAQAFQIGFAEYTANLIIPVTATVILLRPFLLYIAFAHEGLIPISVKLRELPKEEDRPKEPVDAQSRPTRVLTNAIGGSGPGPNDDSPGAAALYALMNPYLDKTSAFLGITIMASTLIVLLALTAANLSNFPVYWVTLLAAFLMACWDAAFGWVHRRETRMIARKGTQITAAGSAQPSRSEYGAQTSVQRPIVDEERGVSQGLDDTRSDSEPGAATPCRTLQSLLLDMQQWLRETFPTVTGVVSLLPFQLIPFAFPIFILVQSLAATGWITLFAHWWDSWVAKTGTVGSIAAMGFLSVILSNFTGTNIGATVLLARVLQVWADLHEASGTAISDRTYWGTVYTLAIGVNYGAFSLTFGASLAGLGWREDLKRRGIYVRRMEFVRVNLPIIAFTMIVSCAILVGEVYIMRDDAPYSPRS
ncbi:hypothetical protein V8F20_007871 [Naviculisporaceae sp. PSN 640]